MGTEDLSNTELFVVTLVQETSLDIKMAGILFDLFEREYESNNSKMTQVDIRSWLICQGVETKSAYYE